MTTDDFDRLRAVAEAATPGPWVLSGDNVVTEDTGEYIIADWMEDENRAFIATFDPPTVVALLDRIERAETERDDWHESAKHRLGEGMRFRGERDELRAAVTKIAENTDRRMIDDPGGNWWAYEPDQLRSLLAAAPTETKGTPHIHVWTRTIEEREQGKPMYCEGCGLTGDNQ